MKKIIGCVISGLLAEIAFFPLSALAQQGADLLMTPPRIVFEGRERSAEVTLSNRGDTEGTYRVDMIELKMDDRGELIPSETDGTRPATPLVRFSPRQVIIPPGDTQTVRLMLRKPADLPSGEYRSHLRVQVVPGADALNNVEPQQIGDTGIAIRLMPIFGRAMPVIVRHGDTEAAVSLAEAKLVDDGGPALDFEMRLKGNRSVYGEVVAEHRDGVASGTQIGVLKGVAVYQPLEKRSVRLKLEPPEGVDLTRGTIRLTYKELPESGGDLDITAETELRL